MSEDKTMEDVEIAALEIVEFCNQHAYCFNCPAWVLGEVEKCRFHAFPTEWGFSAKKRRESED